MGNAGNLLRTGYAMRRPGASAPLVMEYASEIKRRAYRPEGDASRSPYETWGLHRCCRHGLQVHHLHIRRHAPEMLDGGGVAGEDEDLVGAGHLGEGLCGCAGAGGVEVDQDVVDDDRQVGGCGPKPAIRPKRSDR